MKKSPLRKADSSWTSQEIPSFMVPEVSLSCSQEPPSGPYRGTGRGYHCKCENHKRVHRELQIIQIILTFRTEWRWISASRPDPFTPPVNSPLHPLNRKLGGLQSRSAGDRTHDSSAVQPTAQSPHRLHYSGFVPTTSLLNPIHILPSYIFQINLTLSSNLCMHFFSTRTTTCSANFW